MLDVQLLEQARGGLAHLGLVALAQLDHGHDVLLDAHAAEDRGLLRQIADAHAGALVHGLGGDVLAIQQDAAGVGGDQAGDHVEAGGLARAVRAEQADSLAAVQPQADALHHRPAAERLGDAIDEQAFVGSGLGGFDREIFRHDSGGWR